MQGPVTQTQPEEEKTMDEEDIKIETHCHLCRGELKEGKALVMSTCGVNYHEDCAKRVGRCPACGEPLLPHFISEKPKKKMMGMDRLWTILLFVVPLFVVQLLLGIWSLVSHPSGWSVPPWANGFLLLSLIIFVVSLLFLFILYKYGYNPETRTVDALVMEQKGACPGDAESMLYTCGYGERVNPNKLGEVAIPNKAGVQRENVVRVMVDRITMTPDSTFIWSKPVFLKVLKPDKNPQPYTAEQMDEVWKASGRTKIMPEGAEEAVEGQKLCSLCGRPLDYIAEYDAWYCTSCGRYEEPGEQTQPTYGGGAAAGPYTPPAPR